MAFTILGLLTLLCAARKVASHYCEWDLCGGDQYCCGDNLCCDYVNRHWYFWVGVIFLVILLSALGGIFRYYYRRWMNQTSGSSDMSFITSPAYTFLPSEISSRDQHFQITEDSRKPKL